MHVLVGHHQNLFIVGDPDQTIYTWRGANVRYLLDFDQAFPKVKTILMMQNYRSAPQILTAANSLISKNTLRIKKNLTATRSSGAPVLCHHAKTAETEADWITAQMESLHEEGMPWKDMTVLYRAHYLTRSVEEQLLKKEIPYTIYSGVSFFGRMEIKDALCYLRMIAYHDDLSFLRISNVPKRNLGERRRKFLQEIAAAQNLSLYEALKQNLEHEIFHNTAAAEFVSLIERFSSDYQNRPVSEVLSAILDESGYECMLRTEGSQERLDNLAELKQSVHEYEVSCGEELTLENYLAHAALFTTSDAAGTGDKVKLMTVHTAKGLEFPCVFLCGMNEGIFPSRKTRTIQGMEEERRLCFVALTRARDRLYLSDAEGRNFDGSPRYPSRFPMDIDPSLLTFTEQPSHQLLADARSYIALNSRFLQSDADTRYFAPGTRVRHGIFGDGTIEAVEEDSMAYIILFDELETQRRISFRAKLTKI